MSKGKSIKRNFIFNFLLNIFNILFPLVTSPYVSRILGADNLGKNNFAISLSGWFLLFASFGIPNYGIREVAKVSKNKELLSKTFSELFIINFFSTLISLGIYLIFIFVNLKTRNEIDLFLVVGVTIILNIFSLDWFYMGIEEYRYITLRSLFVKFICIISIFLFVKKREDYIIYAAINVLALSFSNILNFRYSKKFVKFYIKNINLKRHINKLIVFFISVFVISIYNQFDQVFLGMFSTNKSVAFYSRARQIYSIVLTITLSISTVLLPKLSYLCENDFKSYKILLRKSIDYIYIISIPAVFGLLMLSKDIMWFFGGKEFEQAYLTLSIVSVLIFVVAIGTWQYNQLFLPLGYEKFALKAQIIMALVSLSLNFILVPKLSNIGASMTIVCAEVIGTIYAIGYAKLKVKEVKIAYLTKSFYKYIFSSICMTLIILIIKYVNLGHAFNIVLSIVVSPIIYFSILYLIKEQVAIEFIRYFSNKFNFISIKK